MGTFELTPLSMVLFIVCDLLFLRLVLWWAESWKGRPRKTKNIARAAMITGGVLLLAAVVRSTEDLTWIYEPALGVIGKVLGLALCIGLFVGGQMAIIAVMGGLSDFMSSGGDHPESRE